MFSWTIKCSPFEYSTLLNSTGVYFYCLSWFSNEVSWSRLEKKKTLDFKPKQEGTICALYTLYFDTTVACFLNTEQQFAVLGAHILICCLCFQSRFSNGFIMEE